MKSNANVLSKRDAPRKEPDRILILATDAELLGWIDEELTGLALAVQVARTTREAVAALIEDPPPRPQIMAADFDGMSPADVLQLHAIREGGWFGSLIAIGAVSRDLERSLNIDRVLRPPLDSDVLRKAVTQVGLSRPTTKMQKIPEP